MNKVFVRYISNFNRRMSQFFPVLTALSLSLLFTISVVRYVSETQQYDQFKGFRVATLFRNNI